MHRELGQNTIQPMNKGERGVKSELARLRSREFSPIQKIERVRDCE